MAQMEPIEGSTVEEAFKEACTTVWEHRQSPEYDSVHLQLYGLYKVATEGKCEEPKPELQFGREKARTKWEAWMRASTFSKEEAMAQYVSVALSVVRRRGGAAATGGGGSSSPGSTSASAASGGTVASGGAAALGEGDEAEGVEKGAADGAAERRLSAQEKEIARLSERTKILESYLAELNGLINAEGDISDDDMTENNMSGRLSKWRDRDMLLWGSSKWEERFVVLSGGNLMIYKSDASMSEVESVMSLKRCVLRDEGTKMGKSPGRGKPAPEYHIFGLYLEGASDRGPDSGVLLRLSTDDAEAADRWMSALSTVCAQHQEGDDDPVDDESTHPDLLDSAGGGMASSASGIFSPGQSDLTSTTDFSASSVDTTVPPSTIPPPPPAVENTPPDLLHVAKASKRKGSWDDAGGRGNSNLQQLRSLSYRIRLDRLGQEPRSAGSAEDPTAALADVRTEKDGEGKPQQHAPLTPRREKRRFDPRGYPASRQMHKECEPSVLSGAASRQNYRGLLNLVCILLLVANLRLIATNIRKYGLSTIVPSICTLSDIANAPRLTGTISLVLYVLMSLAVEKLAMPRPGREKGMLGGTEAPVLFLHGVIISTCLLRAIGVVWNSKGSPVFGFGYLFTAVILAMKLVSYAHANRDLRLAWRARARAAKAKGDGSSSSAALSHGGEEWRGDGLSAKGLSSIHRSTHNLSSASMGSRSGSHDGQGSSLKSRSYPGNITLANMMYFWFAPTLCYQLDYPRSPRIRVKYLVSLVLRLIIVGGAMSVIADEYMLPTVRAFASSDPASNWLISIERLLKLAVPNTCFWLLGFYGFFHLTLNLLAELLRFGDRVFYRDWWNANTIEAYWRLWNLPVHYWMVRHLYFPALRAGFSKNVASALCFLLSAVAHELLVSVPFHMIKFYAFFAMIGNVPLVPLTKMLSKTLGDDQQAGNWIFWVLFCVLGQPMSLMCYYRDYCSEKSCSTTLLE